jgi:hypothetical protein
MLKKILAAAGFMLAAGGGAMAQPATLVVGTSVISGGTTNGLLYNNAGLLGNLSTANNGVLVTSGTGVPSISATLPAGLTIPNFTTTSMLVGSSNAYTLRNSGGAFSLVNNAGTMEFANIDQSGNANFAATVISNSVTTSAITAASLAIGSPPVAPLTIYGSGGVKQLGILDATRAQIVDGGLPSSPVTSLGPTMLVSRYEDQASFGAQNAAIYGVSVGASTSNGQPVAIQGYAYNLGTSDVVALYGRAEQRGTGTHKAAIAGFTDALAYTTGSGAIAFEYETTNNTGQDAPYFPDLTGKQVMIGLDVDYNGVSANYGTVGLNLRAISGPWDVGIGFQRLGGFSPTRTADIQTDSDAVTVLLANSGAHTNGINLTGVGATYSGNAFVSPGFAVSGTGAVSASGPLTLASTINANSVSGFNIAIPAGGGGIDFSNNSTVFRNPVNGALTLTSQTGTVQVPGLNYTSISAGGTAGITKTCAIGATTRLTFTLGILTGVSGC